MLRTLRVAALGLLLASAPAAAQTFQGLDTPAPKPAPKKKKKKSTSTSATKSTTSSPTATGGTALSQATPTPPPPAPAPATSEPALGVDLTQPTPVKPKSAKDLPMPPPPGAGAGKKTAPTTSFEALDVTGKTADRQRLEAANALFLAKEYDKAALAAWELVSDPKMAPLQLESQYLLGKTLYRMGLYHSALAEFSQILGRGEQTRFFSKSLEWLFFISHKTTNEAIILDEVARYANAEWPEKYRSEFYYLLARYQFVRGRALEQVEQKAEAQKSFQEAQRLAAKVPRGDPFYVRTKFLQGVIASRQGDQSAALEDLKEVVRLTRPPADVHGNEQVRDLTFMDLARIHYAARQNRYAIYYYGKIERGRPEWLEALFESAWANYRIGQYQQALGNLVTLSSPFFRDEYFPEALLLKAVVYYENCRYRESTAIIQEFERRYRPVYDELDALVKKDMEAPEYYQVLADVQKKVRAGKGGGTDVILERVLKLALTDRELKNTNDSILEVEKEMDLVAARPPAFRTSDLARHIDDDLKKERQELVKRAGVMARAKLEQELANLRTLLGNGERIKFETTGKEKEFLEEQLQAGGRKAIVKQYRYSVAVADDQLYWPFTGEYWRDELGTYEYTLTKGCVDRSGGNRKVTGAQ
ncbi:MAG TPA: adventurous gliding motility protein GltC [Myxococcaceae bacterium]|nr:adventurous gliding motility protein GltC [Myxococcaceae bacterium]